jgi:hypothetical protein
MNKYLITAAVTIGLITSLIINNHYSGDEILPTAQQQTEINLCTGITQPVSVKTVRVIGGKPFSKHVAEANSLISTCSATAKPSIIDTKTFVDESNAALKTWEFYANWAVWTLPFMGIVYLGGRYYAHNRH